MQEIKVIEQTLNNGNKMIRQVEEFFAENNPNFLELIEIINNEIHFFEKIYDFLGSVSKESFK